MEKNLREKISPNSIKNFIKNRTLGESKKEFSTAEISDEQVKNYALDIFTITVSSRYDIDLARALIEVYGRDIINSANVVTGGDSSLHIATGNKEIMLELINSGGDVNLPNTLGNTPLMCAIYRKNNEVAKILIDHGADVGLKNNAGYPILLCSVRYKDKEMVKLLLKNERDESDKIKTRVEPLIYAAQNGLDEIVEILANDKRTPLDNIDELLEITKTNNHESIINILTLAYDKRSSELPMPKTKSKSPKAVSIKIKKFDQEIFQT